MTYGEAWAVGWRVLLRVSLLFVPCRHTADGAQVPVVSLSNHTFRAMAANLNGSTQSYQPFALRIMQGLKPDIVAIQEFNYDDNSALAFRTLVDQTFGTNFSYYREYKAGYNIPNGIISRYPILQSGSWDSGIADRGYAWALVDLPGTNHLYVVSVHLKASSSSASTRATQATQLKSLITTNFPANSWVIVAGDCNTDTRGETALTTLKTFLSDSPIPTDAAGDADTNEPRSKPYDYVLPSFSLSSNLVASVVGASVFNNGLVFDSRLFSPLSAVAPVQSADSGLAQHMAVIKDFQITFPVTNWITVPPPSLAITNFNGSTLRWTGPSNLSYSVLLSTNLAGWSTNQTVTSSTTNYAFTVPPSTQSFRAYRVAF